MNRQQFPAPGDNPPTEREVRYKPYTEKMYEERETPRQDP